MMHDLDLDRAIKKILWAEALSTSTTLTNITASFPADMQSSHTKMFEGEPPRILKVLKTFGSPCYAARRNRRGKYEERAIRCIVVGYAKGHAPDCYRLFHPQTRKIILSRDVIWNEK